ncbi:MAG: hypothetical protein HDR26_07705 [Lachnospiraceae bacterium]|nr:hypothetical protein [Lachnospiraceae bacterium]
MKQQFLEEWNKFIHAWSVRIVFLLFLAGAVIAAAVSDFTGYVAPFMEWYWGSMGPILFAVVVAGQVAGEYQNSRAAKAAAETKKGQYFAAKVMGLFSLSALFCLMYTAVFSLLCHVRNGAGNGFFSYYPLQLSVFLICRVLTYWIYTAVFILIGVLVRRKFWTFALSCGVSYLEIFLWALQEKNGRTTAAGGPWAAVMQFDKYFGRANFLSYDYFILFVPGVYAGVFALIIGYCIYRRGKLETKSRRKLRKLFSGTTSGLAMISVMFLLFGQANVCAEENAASHTGQQSMENVGELRLVYGDRNLDDSNAFVLLFMAEGFTVNEQENFFRNVETMASALMCISPYDEFADVTKIYAIGTISAQSGSRGDKADTWEAAKLDSRDTFFESHFWEGGVQRTLALSSDGLQKMYELKREFLPAADFCGVIINSSLNGGTAYFNCPAGNIVLSSLRIDTLPHELAHAIAKLADEYDEKGYRSFFTAPNASRQSDPRKVEWAKYIGIDDISVYQFTYNSRWYHPSMTCIMRSSNAGKFCQVCEDALREQIGKYCAESRLLFRGYGKQVLESRAGTDMREFFVVQKKIRKLNSNRIPEELLLLKYYDEDNVLIDGLPKKAGNYYVEAEFLGYQDGDIFYDPCNLKVSYEIKPDSAKVFWLSITPLLLGIMVWIVWLKRSLFFMGRGNK